MLSTKSRVSLVAMVSCCGGQNINYSGDVMEPPLVTCSDDTFQGDCNAVQEQSNDLPKPCYSVKVQLTQCGDFHN